MTRIEKVAETQHITNAKEILLTCNMKCPSDFGLNDECSSGNKDTGCMMCWLRKCKEEKDEVPG